MKAVVITDFGTEPTLADIADPEAGEGEVVVDVEHASVNGMDVATVKGYVQGMMPYELPITLGRDFSGTIRAIGAGVTDLAVGDAVFGQSLGMPLHEGAFAERIKATAAVIAPRPAGLSSADAAALAVAGAAARAAVDAIAPKAGDTVLIAGATGGVGSLAIQMVKGSGATVIATASPGKEAFVTDLGADEVVDRTGDLDAQVRKTHPDGVDAALHLAGDPMALADLLASGGRMASVLGVGQDQMTRPDVTATMVMTIPNRETLAALADDVTSGRLRVPITASYPLDQAGQAVADFAEGATGKLAVAIK
ncbi:MAG TPA: NADP-dependent oxidoreductase [Acidimicrobiales bacterium]